MKRTMNPALGAKRKSFFLFCFTLIAALLFPVLPAESAYWKDLYQNYLKYEHVENGDGCSVHITADKKFDVGDVVIPSSVKMTYVTDKDQVDWTTSWKVPVYEEHSVEVIRIGTIVPHTNIKGGRPSGVYAFKNVTSTMRVTLPNTIVEITKQSFQNSTGLVSIKLNEGLKTIGSEAFSGCTNLITVNIPTTLENIPEKAFFNCSSLPSIHITGAKSIGRSAFEGCTSLVSVNGGNLVCPAQTISKRAFYGCTQLQIIIFASKNLINIGPSAFENCKHLTNITLPASLIGIGDFAFKNTGLKVITNKSTTPRPIKANVFEGVDLSKCILYVPKGSKAAYKAADVWNKFGNILEPGESPVDVQPEETPEEEKVEAITTGLQKIGNLTYLLNEDLTATVVKDEENKYLSGELVIPASVKYGNYTYSVTAFGKEVFRDCSKLTSVSLPNTITEIPTSTFCLCTGLTNITLPSGLIKIGTSAFNGCKALKNIQLPVTLSEIGNYAFYDCGALTSVSIPAGVEKISEGCFESCKKLSNVKLSEGLQAIDHYAFSQCEALTSITLPASLASVGENIFSGDQALSYVYPLNETPSTAEKSSFSYIPSECILYVPSASLSDYQAAEGWKEFKNIQAKGVNEIIKYGKLYYRLSEGGTAVVTYENNSTDNYATLSGEVTVADKVNYKGMDYTVTGVGMYAFRYATGITKVNLPNTIKEIAAKAFFNCTNLEQINIPSYLDVLTDDVFKGTKLYEENIDGDGAVYYDDCLLATTKPLTGDYKVKEGTRLIATWAIDSYDGLTSLVLPEGLQCLCKEAINTLDNLKSISLPSTLSNIGGAIFNECGSLTEIKCYSANPYGMSQFDCFNGLDKSKCTLYVPYKCQTAYAADALWGEFPIIEMEPEVFTVTFLDWNEDVYKTQLVEKGKDADEYSYRHRDGYNFIGWDKETTNVQSDITLTPLYEKLKFSVHFYDWNGVQIDGTQWIEYGESAVAPPDPEREGYAFTGWKTLSGCSDFSIITYTSQYLAQYTEKVWTVTYLNWDGELLGTEEVQDGQDAKGMVATKVGWIFDYWYNTKNFEQEDLKNITKDLTVKAQFTYEILFSVTYRVEGVTTFEMQAVYGFDVSKIYYNPTEYPKIPQKESDDMFDYTFVGWTPEVEYLTNNVVLEAVFESSLRKFTVTFYDWDNTKLDEQQVEHSTDAVAPTPSREGYHFTGWDQDYHHVTMDLDIKALYEINKYTVTFVDYDGENILKNEEVEHGAAATAPNDPTRTGYTFTGWDQEYKNVTSDLTVTAQYEINKYTVRFFGQDGKTQIGENQTVNWNEAATAPAEKDIPAVEGYHFTGWDTEFDHVKADLDVKALYEINKYTVTFVDYDGETILKNEEVEHGAAATAPNDPTRTGYTFTGWDKDFSNVTEDLTVTAQYEVAKVYFTVTYYDWDLTILGTEKVEEGKDAQGLNPEPTREGYTFTEWSKPLTNITSDLSVQAQYEVAKVYFTVTYYDWDLTILGTEKVEEGKDAQGLNPEPTREGYTFTGWSKPLTNITSDLSVQAQYKENVEVDYTPQNLKAALLEQNNDVMITLSWDKVDGAASYELRVAIGENELFSQNTMTLNVISSLLSTIEKEYQLTPGTFTIDWFVRSTDGMGNPISDWAQGESFEVTIKDTGTGIDVVNSQVRPANANSQKLLIDGVLYILRNGHLFDAQGKIVD